MIVCSCNQLTDRQVRDALTGDAGARPRSPGQVYLCLGCKPNCGRCVSQIRQMFADITAGQACQIGCQTCPGEMAAQAIAAQIPAGAPAAPEPASLPPAARPAPRRRLVVPEGQRYRPAAIAPAPTPSRASPRKHARKLLTAASAHAPRAPVMADTAANDAPARLAAE